jgi:acetylornithine deacetylase
MSGSVTIAGLNFILKDAQRMTHLRAAVDQWVDDHQEEILQLSESLIRFQSEQHVPTGWEKDCQMFIAETLRGLNLELDIFEPSEVPGFTEHPAYWPGRDYSNRPNVVGIWRGRQSKAGRSLMFSSHVDVVAGHNTGRFPPFAPVRQGDKLYGRGSNDMKGGLAATIFAVRCLQEIGVQLQGDVYIESVVDEEMGGSNGTLASRLRGHNPSACIVPEPNGMIVSPAHRGGGMWNITIKGVPGMPFGALELINPAYGIGHLIVAIENWAKARNQRITPHPLYTSAPGLPVVLSSVKAGDFVPGTGNSVPSKAELEVWVEVYPGTTLDELYSDFIGHLHAVAAETPIIQQCEMTITQLIRFLPGSEIPLDHPIVQAIGSRYEEVMQKPPEVSGAPFACDVYMFNLYSPTPCVILGPRGANAHAADEWVLMDDLVALTKIFALTAAEWCN